MDRLRILAIAGAAILMLKAPAFAQSRMWTLSDTASADQGQSKIDQDQSQTEQANQDESQASSNIPWWSEDSGWWGEPFDDPNVYQLGWFSAGSCSFGSNLGSAERQLASAGGMSVWFPAGAGSQYSLGSGLCRNNYGYRNRWNNLLSVTPLPIQQKKHHPTWNNERNTVRTTAIRQQRSELAVAVGGGPGPDGDWTRLEDVRVDGTAAAQPRIEGGITVLRGSRVMGQPALGRRHQTQQQQIARSRAANLRELGRLHFAQDRRLGSGHTAFRTAPHIAARSEAAVTPE